MQRIMITCLLFMQLLVAEEILIIGDKNFPKEKLTSAEIKAIFLDKKHFFGGEKILVMNYEFNHPLRICFEKNILEKTQRSLEKYWRKAYYHGKRPPKIVKSTEMLFSYLDNVQPSIGYSDTNSTKNKEVKILYKSECLF